ncbi:MAG: hypothetical protein KC466_05350, partial [Myxococcales bacterium]|nr:hypothetical protein [Myxococcales bacterium]
MTRPIAGISIALFVYALLAALLPLLVQLLILPVEAEANAIAMIFWIGVLLLGAHYASPRDPEKTAELENPLAGFRTALAFTAVALAVGFILYADALRGPFLGGDWSMIARAEALDNAHGLGEALRLLFMPARGVDYHGPLDQLTWWVQYRVWGTNPAPYRVFNLLLHVFNSVLLLRLAARVLRGRTSALIAAGLFVLSPLAIECVVWVSARKDLLGVFFLVATLNTYLRHREKHSRLLGWASLGLFVLGLLSGTLVTLTPIVLFVGEGAGFFPIDETAEARRRSRRELMTFATLALVFFAIWIAARGPSPIPPFADAIDFIGVRVPNQLFVPLYANVGPFDPIDKLSVAGLVLMVVLLSGVTSRGESRSILLALLMIVIGAAAPFLFDDEPSASAGWRPLYLPALGFALL